MVIAVILDTQPSDIWHDPLLQFGVDFAVAVVAFT